MTYPKDWEVMVYPKDTKMESGKIEVIGALSGLT